jgi:hypothetical protein
MSDRARLTDFGREIKRYADVIDAAEKALPGLERPGFGDGWWIEVSKAEYKILGQDRGEASVIFASSDKLEVLEQIFKTVTFDMASELTNHLLDFTLEGAFKARKEHDKVQEGLMGRLHPEWQAHQIKRNAEFWGRWNVQR